MTFRLALLIVAFISAAVLTSTGFGWWEPDNPYQAGWLGLSLSAYFGSLLVGEP